MLPTSCLITSLVFVLTRDWSARRPPLRRRTRRGRQCCWWDNGSCRYPEWRDAGDRHRHRAILVPLSLSRSLPLLFVSLYLRSSSLWITPPRKEEIQMAPWPLVRTRWAVKIISPSRRLLHLQLSYAEACQRKKKWNKGGWVLNGYFFWLCSTTSSSITLLRSITMFSLNDGIFCILMSVPQKFVMDMNNVMRII